MKAAYVIALLLCGGVVWVFRGTLRAEDSNLSTLQSVHTIPSLLPRSGELTTPVRPLQMNAEKKGTLADSPSNKVVHALQTRYRGIDEKLQAITDSLIASGDAGSTFVQRGSQMIERLRDRGLVSDWGCYEGGCFARIAKAHDSLVTLVMEARDAAAPGFIFAITPDDPPNKLVVLLNYSQE